MQQAELLRRRVAFMNTRSAPMGAAITSQAAAICGAQNSASNVGLMPQMQGNNMNSGNQMGGPSMQNVQQQQMNTGNMMTGNNSMNINNPMVGNMNSMVNPMTSAANQMQQQVILLKTDERMSISECKNLHFVLYLKN